MSDFASLLRPETVASLEQGLSQFAKATGNEISVVTITTYGSDETIETYAEKLFQEWGIGKEKEDNGLLLLIAKDDREMRIEVGYGLEPVITDIESGRIIREVLTPAFQAGDYDGGVEAAVTRIIDDIGRGEAPPESPQDSFNLTSLIYTAFFFLIFLSSILARSKSWWAGGIIGAVIGFIFFSWVGITILALIGLVFDFIVSKKYKESKALGVHPPWWIGGPGGRGGGGFGGFGGGSSGGGGASGRW